MHIYGRFYACLCHLDLKLIMWDPTVQKMIKNIKHQHLKSHSGFPLNKKINILSHTLLNIRDQQKKQLLQEEGTLPSFIVSRRKYISVICKILLSNMWLCISIRIQGTRLHCMSHFHNYFTSIGTNACC